VLRSTFFPRSGEVCKVLQFEFKSFCSDNSSSEIVKNIGFRDIPHNDIVATRGT
jgi:hypothetical protein